jgi:hypothetical protein
MRTARESGCDPRLIDVGVQGGQLSIASLGVPPQCREPSVSPPGFRRRLLPGVEVGGHGGRGKGGAVDGDVGDGAGEEVAAALQHPGPQGGR